MTTLLDNSSVVNPNVILENIGKDKLFELFEDWYDTKKVEIEMKKDKGGGVSLEDFEKSLT